jgi:hypothetical protein
MHFADFGAEGGEFFVGGAEEGVLVVDADDGAVCGEDFDLHLVDFAELVLLRFGGTGHAGGVLVLEDVILEGDGGEDAAGAANGDAFFFLEGGVDAGGPLAFKGEASFVFVDGDDAVVADEVVAVAGEEVVGVEGVVDGGGPGGVFFVVEAALAEKGFGGVEAGVGDFDVLAVVVDEVVEAVDEGAGDGAGAEGAVFFAGMFAGEDEGDASFVDEDGVGFVDDEGVEVALDAFFGGEGAAVAKVVEAGFGGSEVGDIGLVCLAATGGVGRLGDGGDGEAEGFVDGAHPLRVAAGEIVVGGEDVDGAGFGAEGGGGDGGEGFAFAGLHFDDAVIEEGEGAPDLFGE